MNCFIILGPQANASENVGTPHLRLTASSIKADTGCFPKKCQHVHGIENAINKTLLLFLDNNPFPSGYFTVKRKQSVVSFPWSEWAWWTYNQPTIHWQGMTRQSQAKQRLLVAQKNSNSVSIPCRWIVCCVRVHRQTLQRMQEHPTYAWQQPPSGQKLDACLKNQLGGSSEVQCSLDLAHLVRRYEKLL